MGEIVALPDIRLEREAPGDSGEAASKPTVRRLTC